MELKLNNLLNYNLWLTTPTTPMSPRGQQKPKEGEKLWGNLQGDQAARSQGYITKFLKASWEREWSKARGTRETWLNM
jgi:hypothetical protein